MYGRELHSFRANFKAARVKGDDPQSIDEALSRLDKHKWIAAIQAEYSALGRKKTWAIMQKNKVPQSQKVLRSKLVFKTKRDRDGNILKYKVR